MGMFEELTDAVADRATSYWNPSPMQAAAMSTCRSNPSAARSRPSTPLAPGSARLHISRSENEIALMRLLKSSLDPKCILNPGKVL